MRITKDYSEIAEITGGEVLATPEYLQAQEVEDWGYIVHDSFVLPFYIKKKLFFRYLLFTLGDSGVTTEDRISYLLNEVTGFIKKNLPVDFILTQHVTALFSCCPQGSVNCFFGSYVVDLSLDEDALFANLHTKHRNVIKKAEKDGVRVSCGVENRGVCEALIQSTLERQHIGLLSQGMLEGLSRVKHMDYWVASFEGELQGAAILLWSENRSAYYMFGGSAVKPHAGAMNLLHWSAMKLMKERGVKYYDFVGARINPDEGSKYEGIQRFKSRFGGELKKGYLWKMPLNKFKYKLFCWLVAAKQGRNYCGDVIDQERKRGNY